MMKRKVVEHNEVISLISPKSPATEAYRTLHTNIQFSGLDDTIQTLTITSPGPSEGKSTTSVNLAVTYAQSGKKVLLVDADLRRPKLHKFFNLSNSRGLTNVVASRLEISEVVQSVKENFSILTTGPIPPNSVELLSSRAMNHFFEKAKEKYDIIIYDTPPVGVVTDAALLATKTDGTLLVVASGKTQIELTKQAKDHLEKVNARILGAIVTMVPVESGRYLGYQYYTYTQEQPMTRKRGFGNRRLKQN